MAKKNTKKSEDQKQISTFVGKLSEDDLAQCLSKSMSLDEICEKFDVKPNTVRFRFAKLMAKEKGLDSFFVESKSPRSPKVKKNGCLLVGEKYVSFMGWKPGAKLDIVTDADQGQIVIRLQ